MRQSAAVDTNAQAAPENPLGEPPPAPVSPSAKAAIAAERVQADLYAAELVAGTIDPKARDAMVEALNRIDRERDAQLAVIRQGAACLLAGFSAGAI
ncbi:MAG: hypothetical protein IT536_14030 [Hyphomicrobiales bacterium]|nr:hypothetical protein [Hyphomicrobiales bacterium]